MKKINPQLKAVLQDFSRGYRIKRQNAFRGYDFETLRTALTDLKDRALSRNEELLARFEEKARAHGSVVLRAHDGAEANDLILEICRTHGIQKIVKSKSMVSEEIGLNDFLAKNGIEARETDLGEWIVQLTAERPTHMVMPAIHLTRRDVAALFSERAGTSVPEDIPSLVRIARGEMRREVFAAQAGLTGANALIAENGAMMFITNEGNGRLVSTIPPVHIVLASIEKVLPTVADALTLLKLLPRNATGQSITSYVSFIAGPHNAAQVFLLLDNHRLEILADPEFREVLRCIKCSACLNVCPVYQIIGGEEYSHIYMGGIGTLFTAWIHGLKKSENLAKVCLRCHRCEEFCPVKIKIADLITVLTERIHKEMGASLWKRLAFEGVMASPRIQQTAFKAARMSRKITGEKSGFSRKLPAWMKKYDRFRALPAPAKTPLSMLFRKTFCVLEKNSTLGHVLQQMSGRKDVSRKAGSGQRPKGPATIFPGCLIEHFYPEIGMAAGRVLIKLGYNVKIATGFCCGFPPSNAGFGKASARAFSSLLKKMDFEGPVVTLCPTCATMLAKRGPELVESEKAKTLAGQVIPFSRFIAENEMDALRQLLVRRYAGDSARNGRNLQKQRTPINGPPESDECAQDAEAWKITYHDSCHHKNLLRAEGASRELLETVLGTKILEMDEPDMCCGFAGSFSIENPEISAELLSDKLAAIDKTEAGIVALDCPGCLLQIRGGCHRKGLSVRVVHTAQILDAALNKVRAAV